jgi:hypothetical protein
MIHDRTPLATAKLVAERQAAHLRLALSPLPLPGRKEKQLACGPDSPEIVAVTRSESCEALFGLLPAGERDGGQQPAISAFNPALSARTMLVLCGP